MIKTPVTSKLGTSDTMQIRDAKNSLICITWIIFADQIVSALNAQKPTCETCGGSRYKAPKGVDVCHTREEVLRRQYPCPICQPATQTEGITGNMKVEKSSIPSRIDYEVIVARQAARIEELEKVCVLVKKWAKHPYFDPTEGPSEDEIIAAYHYRIQRIKAALGKETQNGQK